MEQVKQIVSNQSDEYLSSIECAALLDEKDPLKEFRELFFIPKTETKEDFVYFCGNSLGLQPKALRERIEQELNDWATLGVEGHWRAKHPWVSTDEPLKEYMAEVVGAKKEEVAIMNSLSTNMHLMLVPFYQPTKDRYKIIVEAGAFPSDRYGVRSHLFLHDLTPEQALIEIKPREGEHTLRTEDIIKVIEEHGESIAVIFFSGVQYYTGQYFDIPSITEAGHKVGAYVGFDLAHAVGNVDLHLHDWKTDFAVWCTYKYLNSGPGNIGGCFVHGRITGLPQEDGQVEKTGRDLKRLAGWWGQSESSRFNMLDDWDPLPGADGFRLSNPPVLCVGALATSLNIYHSAQIARLREKSYLLTGYLEYLVKLWVGNRILIISPSDPKQRGCQLSLKLDSDSILAGVTEHLEKSGIIVDTRKPNVIRASPVPLYNSFKDVHKFVWELKAALTKNK